MDTPHGFTGDTNERVLALYAAFEQAHEANDAERAEHLAGEFLDWTEWWHGIESRIGPSCYRLDDVDAPQINWLIPAIHGPSPFANDLPDFP